MSRNTLGKLTLQVILGVCAVAFGTVQAGGQTPAPAPTPAPATTTPPATPPAKTKPVAPPKLPFKLPTKPPTNATAKPTTTPPAAAPGATPAATAAAVKPGTTTPAVTPQNATPGRAPLTGAPAPAAAAAVATPQAVTSNGRTPLTTAVTPAAATTTTATPTTSATTTGTTSTGAAGILSNAQSMTSGGSPLSSLGVPGTGTTAAPGTAQPGASSFLNNGAAASAPGSNGRSAITTQGFGTFNAGDYTLTAYGCERTGTRVLCDFDVTKQNNQEIGLGAFAQVQIVDDGGKITGRHDAFFMAQDGSHMSVAYLSPTPVRYVMEYDDVAQQFNRVTLVYGNQKIQGVSISAAGSQPAGTPSGQPGGYNGKPGGPGMASAAPGGISGAAGDPRGGLTTQGLGIFQAADYTLTAYGCTRIDTRVLCDFDITKQNNQEVGLGAFAQVVMIDDGGKITPRHDAYYMATDGSHLTVAFLSTAPVRYVMEYDNVAPQFNNVALVYGNNKLGGVPITAAGGTQPTATMPGAQTAGMMGQQQTVNGQVATNGQPATGAANGQNAASTVNGATTQAGQAVNTATNAKQKAKTLWNQIKSGQVPSTTQNPPAQNPPAQSPQQ
jgi:hypothetical protein